MTISTYIVLGGPASWFVLSVRCSALPGISLYRKYLISTAEANPWQVHPTVNQQLEQQKLEAKYWFMFREERHLLAGGSECKSICWSAAAPSQGPLVTLPHAEQRQLLRAWMLGELKIWRKDLLLNCSVSVFHKQKAEQPKHTVIFLNSFFYMYFSFFFFFKRVICVEMLCLWDLVVD